MIEVEKKFAINEEQKARLIEGSELASERIMDDVYFDSDDYRLTRADKWLRTRNGKFQLKNPLHNNVYRVADQYDELITDEAIRQDLAVGNGDELAADLLKQGIKPIMNIKTVRHKYKKGPFVIDIDEVDYGDSKFEICEIELMIEDKDGMDEAVSRILEFAEGYGLNSGYVRGKVLEYLKRYRPEHLQALIEAGAVRP